ncbi:MAG: alpha-amylase family glycosyl hydrolase [Anaerolineales bacterium]
MANINDFQWWQRGVIYQIYPRSFMDSDGDGIGDLPGINQRLDYLSDTLGVDAIWLSPFYPSPMADFGYDVADYMNIDPVFGDLEDFDELVKNAHQKDLKVIIDFVPNHSSDQHPWFIESSSSKSNPKRDWYIWQDAKPDGSPPNNWLSVFGGSAWEWHPATSQYYLHSFLKEQPDLNWRNSALKENMFDVLRFWLEREVDGFRIDVAHFIMKDPLLRDDPLKKTPSINFHKPLGEYDSQFHVNSQNHADIHPLYREIRQLLDDYSLESPRVSIGEIHIFDWDMWAKYYGRELDELHLPLNFQLLGVEWQAGKVRQVVDSLEAAIPPGAWPNYVLGNHDERRIASRMSEAEARLAALLLLTLRGTPTMYYGDEIGMLEAAIPPELQQDPWGLRVPGLGRDGCRTPMQWEDSRFAGFSPANTGHTWLPLGNNLRQVNVKKQLDQPGSLLNLYRTILAIRKSSPSLQIGDYVPVDGCPQDCYCYYRQLDDTPKILVALNFSPKGQQIKLVEQQKGQLLLSTNLDREGEVDLSKFALRPYEGVLIEVED